MKKSKIFEASDNIPPIHIQKKKGKPTAHGPQLKNHHNSGGHTGHMDDVNRGSHPDAHEIPSDIMD
jgi:hypothetical protein